MNDQHLANATILLYEVVRVTVLGLCVVALLGTFAAWICALLERQDKARRDFRALMRERVRELDDTPYS